MTADGRESGEIAIGVVIPARNEEARLGSCLRSLRPFLDAGDPVLVVDAASVDKTARIAADNGVKVLKSPRPERGYAVAHGYAVVRERVDAVLLVHADMAVPADARMAISRALTKENRAVGGVLGHRIDDPRRVFRWLERGNRYRAHHWQIPYGDQAQFVRTEAVEAAGGFPGIPRLEDLELSLRLRPLGIWLYLDCPVRIPSRHWRRGVVLTTARNWLWVLSYRLFRVLGLGAAGRQAREAARHRAR